METPQEITKINHVPTPKTNKKDPHGGESIYQNHTTLMLYKFTTELTAAQTDSKTSKFISETAMITNKTKPVEMERNTLEQVSTCVT